MNSTELKIKKARPLGWLTFSSGQSVGVRDVSPRHVVFQFESTIGSVCRCSGRRAFVREFPLSSFLWGRRASEPPGGQVSARRHRVGRSERCSSTRLWSACGNQLAGGDTPLLGKETVMTNPK